MADVLPLAVCHPDQCCAGYCVDEIGLHDVDKDLAEHVARMCGTLMDVSVAPWRRLVEDVLLSDRRDPIPEALRRRLWDLIGGPIIRNHPEATR